MDIDLIVRGICCIRTGVRDVSENIRVISIVDRFLEHSRIYFFQHSRAMYLSSADWMPRNFFSRLEIAYPVLDPTIYRYLEETVIPAYLADTAKARHLTARGVWERRKAPREGARLRSQFFFQEIAENGYKNTALENEPESPHPPPPRAPGESAGEGDGQRTEPKGPATKP